MKTSQAAIILLQKILTKKAREKQHRQWVGPLLANLGRIPQKRAKPDVSFPLHRMKGLVRGQLQSPKPNSQSARQPSSSSTGSTERDALRACRWSSLWARVVPPAQNDGLTTSNKPVEVREVCFLNLTQHFKWAPFFPFFEATIVYSVFGKKVGVSRRLLSVFLWSKKSGKVVGVWTCLCTVGFVYSVVLGFEVFI